MEGFSIAFPPGGVRGPVYRVHFWLLTWVTLLSMQCCVKAANTIFNTFDIAFTLLFSKVFDTFDIFDIHNLLILIHSTVPHTFNTFNIPFDLLFIVQYLAPLTSLISKSRLIYTVDPNMKSSNYMKIWLKALNYFELQQTLKYQFELETLRIKPQLNSLHMGGTLN